MRYGLATSAIFLTLAGCSGSGSTGDSQFNDVATGVTLSRERPLGNGTPAERVTRLAECSAALTTGANGPPPHERAPSLLRTAERLQGMAVQLAGRNGQTAADVTRIRDTAMAANRHLAESQPQEYARLMSRALDACELGAIMTDQELTG